MENVHCNIWMKMNYFVPQSSIHFPTVTEVQNKIIYEPFEKELIKFLFFNSLFCPIHILLDKCFFFLYLYLLLIPNITRIIWKTMENFIWWQCSFVFKIVIYTVVSSAIELSIFLRQFELFIKYQFFIFRIRLILTLFQLNNPYLPIFSFNSFVYFFK